MPNRIAGFRYRNAATACLGALREALREALSEVLNALSP
jgi:hypothetical protein